MLRYVVVWKESGETPLQALTTWKEKNPAYKDVAASYAGRLDPMAAGKLLILLGDECKKQQRYTKLDKEYEIEVLLDVGSDTGDALGLVESSKELRLNGSFLRQVLNAEQGIHLRKYPVYSSKTVNGKPLFMYALSGTLDTIEIPTHEETIYKITHRETKEISSTELTGRTKEFLARVPRTDEPSKELGADFRIDAVRNSWEEVLKTSRTYTVLKLKVTCGSGTYMRSLAERIGKSLGTHALALSITRTKVGKVWNGIWLRSY